MKKKSMVFTVFLVLTFLIIATSAFIILNKKYSDLSASKTIGEKQMELFEAYSKGEKAMFYIDRAAEIAAEEAVYDLGEFGGGISKCGTFAVVGDEENEHYAIWSQYGEDCFSRAELTKSFESIFNSRISSYLLQYPEKNVRMPYSFELFLQQGSLIIIGTSTTDLVIGLGRTDLYMAMGDCGERIITIAQKELAKNVVEQPLGSNCGADVQKYTDGRCEQWCADFVSWVYRESGYPLDKSNTAYNHWRIPYTPNMQEYFQVNELYIPKGTSDPQPGDVAFFWSKTKGRIGHVGIVESFDGSNLIIIEGNSGHRVKKNTYSLDNPSIVGFGRLNNCEQQV